MNSRLNSSGKNEPMEWIFNVTDNELKSVYDMP